MRSIVLKAQGLKKYYTSGENVTKALDGITWMSITGNLRQSWAHPGAENPPCSTCWAAWTPPPREPSA